MRIPLTGLILFGATACTGSQSRDQPALDPYLESSPAIQKDKNVLAEIDPTSSAFVESQESTVTDPPPGVWPADLVGSYYCGDGLGFNIHLDLADDGTYFCQWTGCLGVYGKATGFWRGSEEAIRFTPESEVDMLEGYLRTASVVRTAEGIEFLRTNQDDMRNTASER